MLLRFTVLGKHTDSRVDKGIFAAAGELKECDELRSDERDRLEEVLRWFNRHLTVPRFRNKRAICWFRDDAKRSLSRIWDLVHLLEERGYAVQMLRTRDPGMRLYRDEQQTVAVPPRKRAFARAR